MIDGIGERLVKLMEKYSGFNFGNKKAFEAVRGKKIDSIIQLINNKSYFKVTLGGCVIKKVNQTVIVSKE